MQIQKLLTALIITTLFASSFSGMQAYAAAGSKTYKTEQQLPFDKQHDFTDIKIEVGQANNMVNLLTNKISSERLSLTLAQGDLSSCSTTKTALDSARNLYMAAQVKYNANPTAENKSILEQLKQSYDFLVKNTHACTDADIANYKKKIADLQNKIDADQKLLDENNIDLNNAKMDALNFIMQNNLDPSLYTSIIPNRR